MGTGTYRGRGFKERTRVRGESQSAWPASNSNPFQASCQPPPLFGCKPSLALRHSSRVNHNTLLPINLGGGTQAQTLTPTLPLDNLGILDGGQQYIYLKMIPLSR